MERRHSFSTYLWHYPELDLEELEVMSEELGENFKEGHAVSLPASQENIHYIKVGDWWWDIPYKDINKVAGVTGNYSCDSITDQPHSRH